MPIETGKIAGTPGAASAGTMPWREHWIPLAGSRMRYLQSGSGRPLILLHGLMGYSFSWRFTIPSLARHCSVYAIDNMGAGLSPAAPEMSYSMRASAERLLRFIDAAGITEYDLLGTSHGGAVAMLAAAMSAQRGHTSPKRLILVAPVNPWSPHGRRLAPFVASPVGALLFRATVERYRPIDYLWLRRLFADASKIPPDSLEGYRVPIRENHGFEYGRRVVQTWKKDLVDLELALPEIRHFPTLLMWGTRDRAVTFRSAERLRQNFLECRLVAFEGVGHLPYEEAPEEFNHALVEFLRPDSPVERPL